jgi:hypothetical protein
MAAYEVPTGHVGVHEKTLTADTIDKVTFTADLGEVEILTDGSAAIYIMFGADAEPTVAGTDCWQIPAGSASAVIEPRTSGPTVVNLISSGTPVYSVART